MHAHHQEGCNDLCECKALCSIYDLRSPESAGSIINSLASGGFDYSLQLVNFKLISTINILNFCEIAIRWMPQHLPD